MKSLRESRNEGSGDGHCKKFTMRDEKSKEYLLVGIENEDNIAFIL